VNAPSLLQRADRSQPPTGDISVGTNTSITTVDTEPPQSKQSPAPSAGRLFGP